MEDFDDILGAFNSDEKPALEEKKEEPKKEYNNNYNNGGYNKGGYQKPPYNNNGNNNGYKKPYNPNGGSYTPKEKTPSVWDMTVYKPEKVDVEHSKRTKTFTVFTHGREDISLDKLETIVKVAKALSKKGYTFRCIGDTRDAVTTEICKIEDMKVQFYLPIRKFNEDVVEFETKMPTLKACCIAANYHNFFNMNTKLNIQLSPIERMKHGSRIHVMLGKDCNEHLDLMLLVTSAGETSIVKKDNKIDYKSYGNTLFPIQVAEDTNIKIFNFNQQGFGEKIGAFISKLND